MSRQHFRLDVPSALPAALVSASFRQHFRHREAVTHFQGDAMPFTFNVLPRRSRPRGESSAGGPWHAARARGVDLRRRRPVEDLFRDHPVAPIGEIAVRGKPAPVAVYALAG